MQNQSMEIALIKYNKKTWLKSGLLGFFIGLAVIVPGISGSTVAIIFKLYDQFLYALSNLFKKFKQCFAFLLPIGLGIVLGVLLGFVAVKSLLDLLPFAIVCLFAGLMSGAFPAVKDELKDAQPTGKRILLFGLGLLIPVAMGCFSALSTLNAGAETVTRNIFDKVEVGQVVLGLVFGVVMAITQIVPGLSASAFLMAVGWFSSLVESISLTYWKANSAVFLVYGALGVGFLLGLFFVSKLLVYLFNQYRHTAYSMIVGLSLGSILSMFCNGDIMQVYIAWATEGIVVLDLVLGIVLFAVGVVCAYLLVKVERKKSKQESDDA